MAFMIVDGTPKDPCRVRVSRDGRLYEFVKAKAYHPTDHYMVYCIARKEHEKGDVGIAFRSELPKDESEALALLTDKKIAWFEESDVQPVALYGENDGWGY